MLSTKSRLEIIKYLSSTEAFKPYALEVIAAHLDKLQRLNQFEFMEDVNGNLVYATAWYRLTDEGIKAFKNLESPKRINRGSNLAGVFFINKGLSLDSMIRVFRRILASEKARTLTIYTSRKKMIMFHVKQRGNGYSKRHRVLKNFMKIIRGDKQCHQLQSQPEY